MKTEITVAPQRLRHSSLLAWIYLMRVHSKLQRHSLEHLDDFGLTLAQFDVVAQLSAAPGITQQTLAEKLLVTKGNVCGLIDRLEMLELVERRSDPDDRRANLLFLTRKGEELAERALPEHEEFIREHMSVLSDSEQRTLLSILHNLDRCLENH